MSDAQNVCWIILITWKCSFKLTYFSTCTDDGRTKPEPRDGTPVVKNPEFKCLVRAQSGSKKISTVIEQQDVEKFTTAYSNLLKTSVNGLKRLKKPKKKAMAAQ